MTNEEWHKTMEARMRARFESAERVPASAYQEPLVSVDAYGNEDSYIDLLEARSRGMSEAWAVRRMEWPQPSAEDLLFSLLEEFPEGAVEKLDVSALQKALDSWHDSLPECPFYEVDISRVVEINK